MRIEAQAQGAKGQKAMNMIETTKLIVKESGISGLFRGITPRVGLCIWQTYFMVSIPYILKPLGYM